MSFISMPSGSPAGALPAVYELEPALPAPRERPFGNALYRQRWLGLAVAAVCVLAAGSASWWLRPYYQATGTLLIAPVSLHEADLTPRGYVPAPDPDREMETELAIFGSRAVAGPVIARLQLARRDAILKAALAGARRAAAKRGRRLGAAAAAEIAYQSFHARLGLAPDKLSNLVDVSYGARDPRLAAAVVNAATRQFLAETLAERGAQGRTASLWMRRQLGQARAALARDDAAVAAFQQRHGYIPLLEGGGTESALLGRLDDANHALSLAQANRIAAQAAVASYAGGVVAALPADVRNPAIDNAAAAVSAAQQQLITLATTYRPDFPLMVEARQELAGAKQKLAALQTEVTAGLRQRLAASRQQEQAARALVHALERRAAAASGVELEFGVLQARAQAERTLVNTLAEKLSEVELQASLPPTNIVRLDPAVPPGAPLYPRLGLDLALGLGVGVIAGVAVGLARERWSDALVAGEEVKRSLGPALAPVGMIAAHAQGQGGGRALPPAPGEIVEDRHGYAKAAANLVARCGAPPRAILVTSPNAGEGKTTSVCQLGLALAQAGWRTLIVDADVRRPGCLSFFGLPAAPGLAAAQAGRKVAPLAVAPHLDLLPADKSAGTLQTRAMAGLLEQWREHYDYILMDSPAGNGSGEAVLLSSLVEGVLVVLEWGRTRRAEAQQLCEELARAHAPLLGTLFNRADPGAPAFRPYRHGKAA
jgi:succinoglycan biosynthesis transport protein ExoP